MNTARRTCAFAAALAAMLLPLQAGAQAAQEEATATRSVKCPRPADPRNRHFECRRTLFDAVEETLTGDWDQARTDLAKRGVVPTASYSGAWFGAASGPGTKPTFAGQLNAAVNVDLDKALGAPRGLSFYASGIWAQQTNGNSWLNTNLFAVNSLAAGSTGWLGEAYLQQTLAGGSLTLAGGWIGPASTFASLPVLANYLNTAFATNPTGPIVNDPPFGGPPPNAQWGAQALWNPTPEWQLGGGVFNNNPNAAAGAKHGTNFAFRQGNTGALLVGQASYHPNAGAKAKGLPGHYTFGVVYDGDDFPDLATGAPRSGNWNFYALAQQQVTGTCGSGGVTAWGGLAWASSQGINLLPRSAGVGASWQGPLASRPRDVASAGWFYGKASNTQPGATATQAVELNYQYALTGAVTLIGDFQYLWRLNGLPSPGAAVLGVQANVTF